MARIHTVEQENPLSKVILEMDFDEAIWLTALLGSVHHAHKIGKWNYNLYSALHTVPQIAREFGKLYRKIKDTCSLNDSTPKVEVKPERWEFKFTYPDNAMGIHESEWCSISEQEINWRGMTNTPIRAVSFRRAT